MAGNVNVTSFSTSSISLSYIRIFCAAQGKAEDFCYMKCNRNDFNFEKKAPKTKIVMNRLCSQLHFENDRPTKCRRKMTKFIYEHVNWCRRVTTCNWIRSKRHTFQCSVEKKEMNWHKILKTISLNYSLFWRKNFTSHSQKGKKK